jgi:hypothetical protein
MAIGNILYTKQVIWAEERVPIDDCAICRDPLARKEQITKLVCNHFFCNEDIDRFIALKKQAQANPNCPLCARPIGDRLIRLQRTPAHGVANGAPFHVFKKENGTVHLLRFATLKKILDSPISKAAGILFNVLHWAIYGISVALSEVIKKVLIAVDGILIGVGVLIAAVMALPFSPFISLYIFAKIDPNLPPDRQREIRYQRFQRVVKAISCIVMPFVGILAAAWLKCYRPAVNFLANKIALPKPIHTPKSICNNSLSQPS